MKHSLRRTLILFFAVKQNETVADLSLAKCSSFYTFQVLYFL
jgi:hypothetical protein